MNVTQPTATVAASAIARGRSISMRPAKPILRLAHYLIDGLAVFALYFVLILLLLASSDTETLHATPSILVLMGAYAGYYFLMEYRFQKTLGKFLTKTHVVDHEGGRCGTNKIIGRTICRFIPFDNVSFLLLRNGWHDRISKTTVIHD